MNQLYKYLLVTCVVLSSTQTFASVPKKTTAASKEQQLLEELTGQKKSAVRTHPAVSTREADVSMARRHLNAGYQAYTKKNYILALKHYNTIAQKYPRSPEVRLSYLAKAKLYSEMGLSEQSKRNLEIAKTFETQSLNK